MRGRQAEMNGVAWVALKGLTDMLSVTTDDIVGIYERRSDIIGRNTWEVHAEVRPPDWRLNISPGTSRV